MIRGLLRRITRQDGSATAPVGPYVPAEYWEQRADDLIEGYDSPQSWEERGWLRGSVEETVVPRLLERAHARSVLVVGAGSGRQYEFLEPLGLTIRGFDISPTLVATCRRRYPDIDTVVDSLIGAADRHPAMDAVLSTTVLQHVPPHEIHLAVGAIKELATRLVVLRETTYLKDVASYQWAHDYRELFGDWRTLYEEKTDETDRVRVELIAWSPPSL